jgi:hypothetical protein
MSEPAFPFYVPPHNVDGRLVASLNEGMTLRDYFAAQALAGICADATLGAAETIARCAYQLADAMLKEREK